MRRRDRTRRDGDGGERTATTPRKERRTGQNRDQWQTIRVMSLNVNGLRQERKVKALGTYLASLQPQPDICILVETHPFEHGTEGLVLEADKKAHASCRELEVEHACGGVLIMAKQHIRYRKMDEKPSASLPLNSCSILVYMYARDIPALRMTGIYLPPSAKPKVESVAMLTDAASIATHIKETVGHLMGGDLNHPSWLTGYEEWLGDYGLIELTDPSLGTFASGNSLDEFLFLPGADIPASFLLEGVEADGPE